MMVAEKPKKTSAGIELIRLLAAEGDRIFSTVRAREIAAQVGLKDRGITPVHEFEIAMGLVDPAAVSHWSVLHYHGLTEQVPRKVGIMGSVEPSGPEQKTRLFGRTCRQG